MPRGNHQMLLNNENSLELFYFKKVNKNNMNRKPPQCTVAYVDSPVCGLSMKNLPPMFRKPDASDIQYTDFGKWSNLCPTPLVGTSVSKPQPGHINYQFSHNLAFIKRANSNPGIRESYTHYTGSSGDPEPPEIPTAPNAIVQLSAIFARIILSLGHEGQTFHRRTRTQCTGCTKPLTNKLLKLRDV
ncbi:hypothetical protein JOB18_011033 [Solea senegalensis]|uniref:Uncharacterized protein n=1 Tax=Solea senegalensis TaxID=28829 RepID=A0AAV6QDM4_SOLSE|nr:hypothetical protein JOB18_011033 [Solea senegalensis]